MTMEEAWELLRVKIAASFGGPFETSTTMGAGLEEVSSSRLLERYTLYMSAAEFGHFWCAVDIDASGEAPFDEFVLFIHGLVRPEPPPGPPSSACHPTALVKPAARFQVHFCPAKADWNPRRPDL